MWVCCRRISLPSGRTIAPRAHQFRPPFPPRLLDTARIMKEEPNSAQRRVTHTGPDLEFFGRSVGNEQMHPSTKRARTSLDPSDLRYIRSESIPYPGSNLSHFDGISWNQMPGGRGCPLGSCSQRRTDDCIPLWPLLPSIYPIRIDSVSRFESKSFRRNILESNAGGRGCPPHWASRPVLCA